MREEPLRSIRHALPFRLRVRTQIFSSIELRNLIVIAWNAVYFNPWDTVEQRLNDSALPSRLESS